MLGVHLVGYSIGGTVLRDEYSLMMKGGRVQKPLKGIKKSKWANDPVTLGSQRNVQENGNLSYVTSRKGWVASF